MATQKNLSPLEIFGNSSLFFADPKHYKHIFFMIGSSFILKRFWQKDL